MTGNKLLRFLHVLNIMRTQCLQDSLVTKRGIYYLLEEELRDQNKVDTLVNTTIAYLKVTV